MSDALTTVDFKPDAEMTIPEIEKACADINSSASRLYSDVLELWERKAHWTLYGNGADWSDFAVKMLEGRFSNERGLMRELAAARVARELTGLMSAKQVHAMPRSHLLALSTPNNPEVTPKMKLAIIKELEAAQDATGKVTAVLIEKKVAGLLPAPPPKVKATDTFVSQPSNDTQNVPAETPFDEAVAGHQQTDAPATDPVPIKDEIGGGYGVIGGHEIDPAPGCACPADVCADDAEAVQCRDETVPGKDWEGKRLPDFIGDLGVEVTDASVDEHGYIEVCFDVLIGNEFMPKVVKVWRGAIKGL